MCTDNLICMLSSGCNRCACMYIKLPHKYSKYKINIIMVFWHSVQTFVCRSMQCIGWNICYSLLLQLNCGIKAKQNWKSVRNIRSIWILYTRQLLLQEIICCCFNGRVVHMSIVIVIILSDWLLACVTPILSSVCLWQSIFCVNDSKSVWTIE